MRYTSTRKTARPANLAEAIFRGRAEDGGLYMPERLPVFPAAFFNNISEMPLPDIAYLIAGMLFGDEVDAPSLKNAAVESLRFDLPLRPLDDDTLVFELHHGPTGSFNDIGAHFMAALLDILGPRLPRPLHLVMSTAGDSGAAMACAISGRRDVDLTVVYPLRRISTAQRRRILEYAGDNVLAVESDSPVDNCRYIVNRALSDPELADTLRTTPANSVNIARLLPQISYYFMAYSMVRRVDRRRDVVIGLPGGNLGNLVAGLIAKKMGLPVKRFVVSNNANDAFVRYLADGIYKPRPTVETVAPAIDVGDPVNFERVTALYEGRLEAMRRDIHGYAFTDSVIRQTVDSLPVTLDSAVATAVQALRNDVDPRREVAVALSTAAPEEHIRGPLPRKGIHILPRYQLLKQIMLEHFA